MNIQDFPISKITLGTVQIGLKYGIANKSGIPSQNESLELLDFAIKAGINSLDTAPAYGESELRIGEYISKYFNTKSTKLTITTKFGMKTDFETLEYSEIYNMVKKSVTNSLKNLNITKIPIYMLHQPALMHKYDGNVVKSLIDLKHKGLINRIGVSIYTMDEIEEFLKNDQFDAIQIPINVLDQDLIHSSFLNRLKRKEKLIFARSIFLQGLIFLNPNDLSSYFNPVKKPLKLFHKTAKEENRTIAELALAYIRDLPEITSLVLGVDSIQQLKNNLNLINSKPLSLSLRNRIDSYFQKVPRNILNPSLWPKK